MRRFALLLCAALLACGAPTATSEAPNAPETSEALSRVGPGPHDVAVIDMGELGVIRVELLHEIAPAWVAHVSERAEAGLYDGTSFHRVIPGFMVQGGGAASLDNDPRNDAVNVPEDVPPHEFSDYPHVRGTVAMANQGPHKPGSVQFFVVHGDARHLDGGYTVIGRVAEGMEVVDAITELEIDEFGRYGPRNRPYPVEARIQTLRIEPGRDALAGTPTAP